MGYFLFRLLNGHLMWLGDHRPDISSFVRALTRCYNASTMAH